MSPSLPDDTLVLLNDDSSSSWWIGLETERKFGSPLSFDATESGLFNGNFVPPPPRPPFLDESAQFDGLTTCGMCSWATKNDHLLATSNNNSTINVPGEWSFSVLIVIVSVISALIGAFVMVTFLRCRRLKAGNSTGRSAVPWWPNGGGGGSRTTAGEGGSLGPNRGPGAVKHGADAIRVSHAATNSGVWTWLGQRRVSGGPDPLSQPSSSPAENHYTHMDDSYNPELGEALYAELDRESMQSGGNPSYQNTAYSACGEADKELQVFSSAPSSAYYSDLSVTTTTVPSGERTYEMVGLTAMNQNCCPLLDSESGGGGGQQGAAAAEQTHFDLNVLSVGSTHPSTGRRQHRLSAINEGGGGGGGCCTTTNQLQPSDFV